MAVARKGKKKAARTKRAAPRKLKAKRIVRGPDSIILDEINKLAAEESALRDQLTAASRRLAGLRLALDAMQGKPVAARVKTRGGKSNGATKGRTGDVYEQMKKGTCTVPALAEKLGMDIVPIRNAVNYLRKSGKVESVEGERGTYRAL